MDKDTLDDSDVRGLIADRARPCVSVYMPTHPGCDASRQDAIRLRGLLDQAEGELVELGLRPGEARQFVQRARALPEDASYWAGRLQGLAIFISPHTFRHFRLPGEFEDLAYVDSRFLIKPLLPPLATQETFCLLALSQKRVRLFLVGRDDIQEIQVAEIPSSLEDALGYVLVDRGAQIHAGAPSSKRKESVVYHGQKDDSVSHKEELVQYYRLVDASVRPTLVERQAPLMLAGVAESLRVFREGSRYDRILESQLEGNWDRASERELHEAAWRLFSNELETRCKDAAKQIRDSLGGRKASDDVIRVARAAQQGKVDTLMVERRSHQWCSVDLGGGVRVLHGRRQIGDEDLLDVASAETIASRGRVFAVDQALMPTETPAAALFRYEA